MAAVLAGAAGAQDGRVSTYEQMAPELRAMQDDDFSNPGLLWAQTGEELWAEPSGADEVACAECHGAAEEMAGVAAHYPDWDEESGQAVDLAARINLCRQRHQGAEPLERGSEALLALTTLVALQSRGQPIAPSEAPQMEAVRGQGEALYSTRMGQLNLACATCHDDLAGGRLLAAEIPQAHPTGYPQYRLEWQEMGDLDRRLRNCMVGVRAEPFAAGSQEFVALEAYLKARAVGMEMEAPAIRP
ncbi:sulfur oxidation c-type cytochrome SoxA [Pseudoroseicyclus tamaricis]|uniref:sulfur oxidation c-type cytochrome SoxA n=1 Tax=Pseudoroseicyclus tamaricis TaxID=2705421 RepID=UPI001F1FF44D|nr:sulfur oxidation c-type cytochrome SoxA [Pseudoroseicyclus tamaricis]